MNPESGRSEQNDSISILKGALRSGDSGDIAAACLGGVFGGLVDVFSGFTTLSVGSATVYGAVGGLGLKRAVQASIGRQKPIPVAPSQGDARQTTSKSLLLLETKIREMLITKPDSGPLINLMTQVETLIFCSEVLSPEEYFERTRVLKQRFLDAVSDLKGEDTRSVAGPGEID